MQRELIGYILVTHRGNLKGYDQGRGTTFDGDRRTAYLYSLEEATERAYATGKTMEPVYNNDLDFGE